MSICILSKSLAKNLQEAEQKLCWAVQILETKEAYIGFESMDDIKKCFNLDIEKVFH